MRKLIAIAITAAALAAPVPALACDGYETIDGCIGIDEYNEWYSYENLSAIPSLSFPGQTVVDVYGITDDGVEPVDRPREFMGEPEETIREIIAGKLYAL